MRTRLLPVDEIVAKATTLAADLDALIPEIWAPRIERNLRKADVMLRTLSEFTALEGTSGDILHVPVLADLSEADPLTDGTDIVPVKLNTPSLVDFIPTEYGKAVELTEKGLNRYNYNMIAWVIDALSYSMTQRLNNTVAGLYTGLTTNVVRVNDKATTDDVTSADVLDAVTIRKAVRKLMELDAVPFEGNVYYLYVTPKQYTDLFEDEDIKDALRHGMPDAIFSGILPEYHHCRIVVSNYVKVVDNGAAVPVHRAMLVSQRWAGIAWKMRPRIVRDPLKDFGRKVPIGIKADFQIKLLHEPRAVLIESA